jgi:DNA-binding beta-propeller fold protein YncE
MGRPRPAWKRATAISLAALVAALALAAAALAATGDLNPEGCIDDRDTGADTCFQTADGLNGAAAVAVSPDGRSVYVASNADDAVARFDRDPATGDLTPRGCVEDNDTGDGSCAKSTDGLDRPGGVAVSPDGESVYVASIQDDAVVRFKRNTTTGALIPKGCVDDDQAGQGPDACADSTAGLNGATSVTVSPDGESVYATAADDSTIVRFNRAPSGALTAKGCIDDAGGNDCGTDTTDGLQGANSVAVSPDGTSVYVASTQDDAIARFDRNTTNGKLTPKGCVGDVTHRPGPLVAICNHLAEGLDGAWSVAVSPDGTSVYATGFNDDTVVWLKRDPSDGSLSAKDCVEDSDSDTAICGQHVEGLTTANSVAVSPDGGSVYVSSLGALVHLERNENSGGLIPKGCVEDDVGTGDCGQTSDGLSGAFSVALSPDGGSLYVAAEGDDAIVQFARAGS